MAEALIMPKLDMTMVEGTLLRWYKQEGELVKSGDLVFEVQADKISIDIESPATGILRGVAAAANDRKPVGFVLGWVVAEGEDWRPEAAATAPAAGSAAPTAGAAESARPVAAAGAGTAAAAGSAGDAAPVSAPPVAIADVPGRPRATPAARRLARELGVDLAQVTGSAPDGCIIAPDVAAFHRSAPRVTPVARKAAAELGVALAAVQGSGTNGKVMWADVAAAAAGGAAAAAAPATAPAATPATTPAAHSDAADEVKRIPLTGVRSIIARRMQESAQNAPHVTLFLEVDMTEAARLRGRLNALLAKESGPKLSYNTLLAFLTAKALTKFPALNATWDGGDLLRYQAVHLAMAVDTPNGLLVPVLPHAQTLGLLDLAQSLTTLAEKARTGKLLPAELSGGTFTISNLGAMGIEGFTPIINQPQVAILGAGAVIDKVVAYEGQPAVRPRMTLSLSFDHRALDGADGARFLAHLRDLLEAPERSLL